MDEKMTREVRHAEDAAFEPTGTDEPTDLPAAVEECIRRIDAAREQITSDQTDIDHLQAETRAILERLRVALPAA
jgi:hypothetical protein